MAKLPAPPSAADLRVRGRDGSTLPAGTVLWRVHDTVGAHILPWNELRRFGPTSSRFDPQDPPPHLQSRGVTYLAADLSTALAERFQDTRVINRRRGAPSPDRLRDRDRPATVGPHRYRYVLVPEY